MGARKDGVYKEDTALLPLPPHVSIAHAAEFSLAPITSKQKIAFIIK